MQGNPKGKEHAEGCRGDRKAPARSAERNPFAGWQSCRKEQASEVPSSRGFAVAPGPFACTVYNVELFCNLLKISEKYPLKRRDIPKVQGDRKALVAPQSETLL